MKAKISIARTACTRLLPLLLVLTLPAVVQAQFSYIINNDGTITITGGCPSGAVVIPEAINGLPVTSIGDYAFASCFSLTSVVIPDSVTSIGNEAFASCYSLTSVVIPDSVTSIGDGAFYLCSSLTGVYFEGNAPSVGWCVFCDANNATGYYLRGTEGWGPTFGDRPTAFWHLPSPVILSFPPTFGFQNHAFGFRVSWAANADVVVEAASNLTNPVWVPVGTNTITMGVDPLTDGWFYFSDPDWANYPARFYRVWGVPVNPDPARLAWIPPGTFTMGSPPDEPARREDEGPQTQVTISRGFCMGKYEVTQGEYLEVVGFNPSYFTGDLSRPVEQVSWHDAANYCALLTERERLAGRLPLGWEYRLPTEAQWEYACRAGTRTALAYGPALRSGMANFDGRYEYPPCGYDTYYCYNPAGTSLGRTTSVGSYAPNAWGLYDMHGNVWEWCQDWWSDNFPGGSVTDPTGAATSSLRVLRGGSWVSLANRCRSAFRGRNDPDIKLSYLGFRVALVSVP